MAAQATPTFLARVHGQMHLMRPAERRLADFVLSFPGELASYTATELARLANVSNATVSQFVQRLGYATYEEARLQVRAQSQTGAALFLPASRGEQADVLAAHVDQSIANIGNTFAAISLAEVDEVARSMLAARRVFMVGFRSSAPLAAYLRWQALQIVDPIIVLPGAGETLGENVASISRGDCVIVFGLRRRPARMDALLTQICKSEAEIAYITDAGMPRQQGPKWHFMCQTPAPGPLFNHTAVLALCHLLATRLIELAGRTGRRRLSAIEAAHDALDEI